MFMRVFRNGSLEEDAMSTDNEKAVFHKEPNACGNILSDIWYTFHYVQLGLDYEY